MDIKEKIRHTALFSRDSRGTTLLFVDDATRRTRTVVSFIRHSQSLATITSSVFVSFLLLLIAATDYSGLEFLNTSSSSFSVRSVCVEAASQPAIDEENEPEYHELEEVEEKCLKRRKNHHMRFDGWRDLATFNSTTHRWLIESMECQPESFVLSGIMAIQKYNIIESPPQSS